LVFLLLLAAFTTDVFLGVVIALLIGPGIIHMANMIHLRYRVVVKHGVWGGIWLALPVFVYFFSNS